jgi:protein SCO1/2
MRMRGGLIGVAAVVLLAGCGSTAASRTIKTPPARAARFSGGELRPPRAAAPIALHDARGRPVTLAGEHGRYVLVTFLYTHCPDVCPLIAQNLNLALRKLGADRAKVRVLAVSVDPKGDTATAVQAYERRLRLLPQFRYLVGSRADLEKTWIAWRVEAVRSSPALVDHIAYTALVDPEGKERLLYGSSVRASQVLHDLRILMR